MMTRVIIKIIIRKVLIIININNSDDSSWYEDNSTNSLIEDKVVEYIVVVSINVNVKGTTKQLKQTD